MKYSLEELQLVIHSLRHDCDKTKSAKKAIKIISEKTGLDKERVKEIVIYLNEDKNK